MLFQDPYLPLLTQLNRAVSFAPPVDVAVSEGDVVLTMDVPGLSAEDLSIEMVDGHLMVRGTRRRPEVADGVQLVHAERPYGSFERRVTVPDGVDGDHIMASLDNGVLSLIIPKPERLKPRTIAIATGSGTEQRELEAAGD